MFSLLITVCASFTGALPLANRRDVDAQLGLSLSLIINGPLSWPLRNDADRRSTLSSNLTTRDLTPRNDLRPMTLTRLQSDWYTEIVHFASAAYCDSDTVNDWTCGPDCEGAHANFVPLQVGGDQCLMPWWYVGWDPKDLTPNGRGDGNGTIVVAHQGTSSASAFFRNLNVAEEPADRREFPTAPQDSLVHAGYHAFHQRSADTVFEAVKEALDKYPTRNIVTTGHSLGGALALLDAISLADKLSNVAVSSVTFGAPRIGNLAFANYANQKLDAVRQVTNKRDPVPVYPLAETSVDGVTYKYSAVQGEVHIDEDSTWRSCPGNDNSDAFCSAGISRSSGNILEFGADFARDHSGPYNGVLMGRQCSTTPSQALCLYR